MARAFQDLQPYEVVALAIAVESRNAERYETFTHLFTGYNDEASSLFAEMRDEELEHRDILREVYRSRYGNKPCAIDEGDVDEVVEAVDIMDAEHFVFDSMTRRGVLEAALRAEAGAQQFYAALCETVQDKDLLELYGKLAQYEEHHLSAIQRRIDELDLKAGKGATSNGAKRLYAGGI